MILEGDYLIFKDFYNEKSLYNDYIEIDCDNTYYLRDNEIVTDIELLLNNENDKLEYAVGGVPESMNDIEELGGKEIIKIARNIRCKYYEEEFTKVDDIYDYIREDK